MDANGNVGIGTTSPRVALDVMDSIQVDERGTNNGTLNSATSGNGILFGGGASGEGIISKRTAEGNRYGLDFITGYNSRVSITNGGDVGIGTTNPTAGLEVNGDIKYYNNCCDINDLAEGFPTNKTLERGEGLLLLIM